MKCRIQPPLLALCGPHFLLLSICVVRIEAVGPEKLANADYISTEAFRERFSMTKITMMSVFHDYNGGICGVFVMKLLYLVCLLYLSFLLIRNVFPVLQLQMEKDYMVINRQLREPANPELLLQLFFRRLSIPKHLLFYP